MFVKICCGISIILIIAIIVMLVQLYLDWPEKQKTDDIAAYKKMLNYIGDFLDDYFLNNLDPKENLTTVPSEE